MAAEPIEVNEQTWQATVMNSQLPVLVDFWAEHHVPCPCKTMAPAVQELAAEYAGQLLVAKLDVGNNPKIAKEHGVRKLPSIIFFEKGQPVDQIAGAVPKSELKQKVDDVLAAATIELEEKMATEPIEVNEQNWETEVMNSELPVLVDFWAEWCGPCKMIAPAVHDLAGEYAGQLSVGKLDVDSSPNIAMQYNVRSIPALIFFKDGQPVDQIIGALPKGAIKKKIDAVLGS